MRNEDTTYIEAWYCSFMGSKKSHGRCSMTNQRPPLNHAFLNTVFPDGTQNLVLLADMHMHRPSLIWSMLEAVKYITPHTDNKNEHSNNNTNNNPSLHRDRYMQPVRTGASNHQQQQQQRRSARWHTAPLPSRAGLIRTRPPPQTTDA